MLAYVNVLSALFTLSRHRRHSESTRTDCGAYMAIEIELTLFPDINNQGLLPSGVRLIVFVKWFTAR